MLSNSHTPDAPNSSFFGTLYIIATPIGNLGDITFRAIDTLKKVDFIAAEDTRHTRKILSYYRINSSLISCHEHNETSRIPLIIGKLKTGQSVALVSDAGTPSISDPGYRLAAAAITEGISVIPIPGASAAITALSVSGLPSDAFFFAGFLPSSKTRRRSKLSELAKISTTLIFYESPRRIQAVLEDMLQVLGDCPAVLAREMTKIHEEFIRAPLSELITVIMRMQPVKGEITLLISPLKRESSVDPDNLEELILSEIKKGKSSASSLAKELAKLYGMPKNKVYDMILKLKLLENINKKGEESDG